MEKHARVTNQRAAILDYLKGNHEHPSAEHIYLAVKKKLPHISRGTVYRNLQSLKMEKRVFELKAGNASHFETRYVEEAGPHHHLICRSCGKIDDFFSETLNKYSLSLAKKQKNFSVEQATMNFYGICNTCKGRLHNDKNK